MDSLAVTKLIAFQRSFDIDIAPTVTLLTYQQAGQLLGFNGVALYYEDLFRSAPFDSTTTLKTPTDATPSKASDRSWTDGGFSSVWRAGLLFCGRR